MYKIIGADQKEYGPVTAEQIRQWIVEGRANAQTQVRLETDAAWKPLAAFPEFAAAFGGGAPAAFPPSPTPFAAGTGHGAAADAVKGPAIALMISGIIGILWQLFGILGNLRTLHHPADYSQIPDPQVREIVEKVMGNFGALGIVQNIFCLAMGALIIVGTLKMMRLESYRLALAATIIAMLPCVSPCCWLGLPFGIWAIIVLNKPEVKSQFS